MPDSIQDQIGRGVGADQNNLHVRPVGLYGRRQIPAVRARISQHEVNRSGMDLDDFERLGRVLRPEDEITELTEVRN